jgi:hypothetical protein
VETRAAFSSEELVRAVAIARADALEEAAKIALEDHTPGYGALSAKLADTVEWLAKAQRQAIADRIRFSALRDFPNLDAPTTARTNISPQGQQTQDQTIGE